MILAIDPGPTESGMVLYDGKKVVAAYTLPNDDVLEWILNDSRLQLVAIEMVASFGMAVGKEVFETVRWIGRFQQACPWPDDVVLVYRLDVKLHLCKSARAKDANVRQALIDLVGAPGTKKNPGPTYGVKGDAWSALAVAVVAWDNAGVRKL